MSFKIDFSKLPDLNEIGKSVLSSLEGTVNDNISTLKSGSLALADSAKLTGEIALEAIQGVLSKKIDLIAAERIARRSMEQTIGLATAGGNLVASTSLNTLKEFALGLIKLAPGLLKIV